jgi:hypothetical protein
MRISKVAWAIGHDGPIGMMYIWALGQVGSPEIALQEGLAMVRKHPSAALAVGVAQTALDLPGGPNMAVAQELLDLAQKQEADGALTRLLEYNVRMRLCPPEGHLDLCREFLQRHDLTPTHHRHVLIEYMWSCLMAGQRDLAEKDARRLLSIEDCGEAELALWAITLHSANQAAAQMHLNRASTLGKAKLLYFQAVGYRVNEDYPSARAKLEELQQVDAAMAGRCAQFLRLPEEAA